MKRLLILILCLSAHALWAQEKEKRSFAPFSRIEFEGRGNLYLTPDDHLVADIEVSDGEMDKVKTWVSGKTLHIKYEKEEGKVFPVEPKIDVYLNYRQLDAIKVAGIVNVKTEKPIQGKSFAFEVEGMGKNYLDVEVETLQIGCSGTANIYLSGEAEHQEITLDGTGTIDAFDLISSYTTAEVNGTGSLLVNARESLEAEVSGFGAEIRYRGNPKKKNISKSGFVQVKPEHSR